MKALPYVAGGLVRAMCSVAVVKYYFGFEIEDAIVRSFFQPYPFPAVFQGTMLGVLTTMRIKETRESSQDLEKKVEN